MQIEDKPYLVVEQKAIPSQYLKRQVIVDCYLPKNITDPKKMSLLLINDGQDLADMHFSSLLNTLFSNDQLTPLFCIGLHTGRERKNEYGTAYVLDFEKRGAKAADYQQFILMELLPFIQNAYAIEHFKQKAICGFSLGGLSAIDTVWNHPEAFSIAGVFSGSLWWRTKNLNEGYNEATDRIMHKKIRDGLFREGLKFYFTTGSMDETADRNNNGVIDSIDDTEALITELKLQGYSTNNIAYINYHDGKHDVATWGRAMPAFLEWGWGASKSNAV